jgi:hypothetical protein
MLGIIIRKKREAVKGKTKNVLAAALTLDQPLILH